MGTNSVQVNWPRKTGRMRPALRPAPATEELVEAVPACYNSQSKVKVEIQTGQNQIDLDLKSR